MKSKTFRFNTEIKTLALMLGTSVSMLIGYAHSQGFNWVNENSKAFYWLDKGELEFAFFELKA